MSSDSTILKAISLQIDELTKQLGEFGAIARQLRDDALRDRINILEKHTRDMNIKLDTVLGEGSSGLTIVTDTAPLVKRETKRTAVTSSSAGTPAEVTEVKDPGAIEGNIIEFFKEMWISHFPMLLEKKLVTIEHERKRAEIEEKNKTARRGSTDAQRKEAHLVYKSLKDDVVFKDTLIALRNSQTIEYAKSTSTQVQLELTV